MVRRPHRRPVPEGEPVWAGLDLGVEVRHDGHCALWMRPSEPAVFGAARVLTPPRDGNF